jgi:hypothetical protein
MKKTMSSAKSMEMDLDAISNEGNLRVECDDLGTIFANCVSFLSSLDCSYQKTTQTNGFTTKPAHDYKGEAILGLPKLKPDYIKTHFVLINSQ